MRGGRPPFLPDANSQTGPQSRLTKLRGLKASDTHSLFFLGQAQNRLAPLASQHSLPSASPPATTFCMLCLSSAAPCRRHPGLARPRRPALSARARAGGRRTSRRAGRRGPAAAAAASAVARRASVGGGGRRRRGGAASAAGGRRGGRPGRFRRGRGDVGHRRRPGPAAEDVGERRRSGAGTPVAASVSSFSSTV